MKIECVYNHSDQTWTVYGPDHNYRRCITSELGPTILKVTDDYAEALKEMANSVNLPSHPSSKEIVP